VVQGFTIAIAAYAAMVGAVAVVLVVRRAVRPAWLDKGVLVLEIVLVVRAMIAVGEIVRGDQPTHLSTHVGYLIASVVIVPIATGAVADERDHWTSGVLAVAVIAVLVVVIRLQMTAAGHA
jgi:cyanate permease